MSDPADWFPVTNYPRRESSTLGEKQAIANQKILLSRNEAHFNELVALRLSTASQMSQHTDLIKHLTGQLVDLEKRVNTNHVSLASIKRRTNFLLESAMKLVMAIAIGYENA